MKFKKILKLFIILPIVVLVGLFISYLLSGDIREVLKDLWEDVAYSLVMGLSLWIGNREIFMRISKIPLFNKNPFRLFITNTLFTFIYSVVAINLVYFLWFMIFHGIPLAKINLPPVIYIFVILTISTLISFVSYIKRLIQDKQKFMLHEERLKTEIIKLEYETLKNQVNPHFLFNSLNALTSLVAENDEAVRFIKNLADVYRYVLEQKDNELVELKRELEFVSAYLYLHQIRFGKSLEIDICKAPANKMVVPLAVQMLVENAIKHNEISIDAPLKLLVFIEDNFLVVKNSLQLKSMIDDSSKIGLSNIQSRYSYLTDIKIVAGPIDNEFVVKLPLLDIKRK